MPYQCIYFSETHTWFQAIKLDLFSNFCHIISWIIIIPFFTDSEMITAFKSNQPIDLIPLFYLLRFCFLVFNIEATFYGPNLKGIRIRNLRLPWCWKSRRARSGNLPLTILAWSMEMSTSEEIARNFLGNLKTSGWTWLWRIMASPFSKLQWVTESNWETEGRGFWEIQIPAFSLQSKKILKEGGVMLSWL